MVEVEREHEWVCTDCGAKYDKHPAMCDNCGAETFALLQKEYDAVGNLVEEPEEEAPVEEEDEVILEEEEAPEEVMEEEESDDEDLEAYLEELPVKELKKLCDEVDLSKKGKKADLVARLLE